MAWEQYGSLRTGKSKLEWYMTRSEAKSKPLISFSKNVFNESKSWHICRMMYQSIYVYKHSIKPGFANIP